MIMISLTTCPTENSKEIGKRFLELHPLPDSITMVGTYITSSIDEGIRGIAIYEFDESKYPEASKVLNERLATYIGIPGFTYSLTQWLEPQDALSLIGLA